MASIAMAHPRRRSVVQVLSALHLEVAALVALSVALDFWRLAQNGWANVFYSAAVRSMSANWHNFLYASQDPAGIMTVDKPPLAVWIQALSARLFGFQPLAILIPQAVIGTLTVVLVYDLVRTWFGRAAGFVAGAALAVTPITVAISRHNNPDALLMLCCTAAVWCTVRGLGTGHARWLTGAGVCVGLGFETKMAVALVVVPAIALGWFWVAPHGRVRAVGHLLRAGGAAVALGVAWPLFVALTPPGDRPWISGTSDNSVWSLMVGYNGLGRVAGQAGGPGPATVPGNSWVFGGVPGPFRLINESLGIQAGWLLGFAVAGTLAIVVGSRLRRRDPRTGWLVAVAGTFAAIAVVFSAAKGIFHPYYVSLLAPFSAALVGAGAAELLRARGVARVLAPLTLAAGAATEAVVIQQNPSEPTGLIPLVVGCVFVVGGVVAAASAGTRLRGILLGVAIAGLLVAPAAAAVQTLAHRTSSTFPAGGPPPPANPVVRNRTVHTQATRDRRELVAVLRYIRAHGGGALGVRSQEQAAYAILGYHGDVAGLGGFSGQETQMSPAWFGQAVHDRRIRWVLFNGPTRVLPGHRVGVSRLLRAVAHACRRVPPAAYTRRARITRGALYDCRGAGWRLEAMTAEHS